MQRTEGANNHFREVLKTRREERELGRFSRVLKSERLRTVKKKELLNLKQKHENVFSTNR